MKIKYSGPRAVISEHGVSFKGGKEDKYVYLMISLQILRAIDQPFEKIKSYSYDTTTHRLNNDEMLEILEIHEPNIEQLSMGEMVSYEQKLNDEISKVDQHRLLNDLEKKALKNNLIMMKSYQMQRAVNKIYYMHSVKDIAHIIKREEIKELQAPFYEKFWHVFQTIQGELEKGRGAVRTRIKVKPNNEGKLTVKLLIDN